MQRSAGCAVFILYAHSQECEHVARSHSYQVCRFQHMHKLVKLHLLSSTLYVWSHPYQYHTVSPSYGHLWVGYMSSHITYNVVHLWHKNHATTSRCCCTAVVPCLLWKVVTIWASVCRRCMPFAWLTLSGIKQLVANCMPSLLAVTSSWPACSPARLTASHITYRKTA